ncbi:MAG: citrate lyase subunit beta/citryl-CoA lyase [Bacteroidia bacterium]|jgi:citrate lyase subunit beta/citryl-CoA lyase
MLTKKFRSLLFIPASRPDMVERAHERAADAIILDMEDGVAETEKIAARKNLNSLLASLQGKGIETLVRINSLETGGDLDIGAISDAFSPPLLLPKITNPEQVLAVEDCWLSSRIDMSGGHSDETSRETARETVLSTLRLLPMIECPTGLFRVEQIATATKRVRALVFGSEDFAAEAGLSTEIEALAMPAQWVALAAAANGISAYGLPGSLGNYHNMELFEATLKRARTIGFTGSVCIHPKQVLLANQVFKPSKEEIEWADSVISQAGDGGATGGAIGMVDAPVLARALAILARV